MHLEALWLDRLANVTLILKFGELASPSKQPTVDELVAASGRAMVKAFEIHRWVHLDGVWRRDAATRHFISF